MLLTPTRKLSLRLVLQTGIATVSHGQPQKNSHLPLSFCRSFYHTNLPVPDSTAKSSRDSHRRFAMFGSIHPSPDAEMLKFVRGATPLASCPGRRMGAPKPAIVIVQE